MTTSTTTPTPVENSRRDTPRRLEIFNVRQPQQNLDEPEPPKETPSRNIAQSLFSRSRGTSRASTTSAPRQFVQRRLRPVTPVSRRAPTKPQVRARTPVSLGSIPRPHEGTRISALGPAVPPPPPAPQPADSDLEYEYYYDYLDSVEERRQPQKGNGQDYDLIPLADKVRILSDGLPHCLDVGVFPHPFSCMKFVNCFRNPGTGIQGSIYQCPSYLAFDPVGGRCNWVNEIVCASTN